MLDASSSPYSVTAVYSGDASYGGSVSPSQNLTVTAAQTTSTVLSLSGGTTIYGNEGTVVFRSAWRPVQRQSDRRVLVQTTVAAPSSPFATSSSHRRRGYWQLHDDGHRPRRGRCAYSSPLRTPGTTTSVLPFASAPLVVNQATSTVALTISPSSATYGNLSSVSFHAVVSRSSSVCRPGRGGERRGETLCTVALVAARAHASRRLASSCRRPEPLRRDRHLRRRRQLHHLGDDGGCRTHDHEGDHVDSVTVAPSSVGYGNEARRSSPSRSHRSTPGRSRPHCRPHQRDHHPVHRHPGRWVRDLLTSGAALDPGGSPYTIIATYPGDAQLHRFVGHHAARCGKGHTRHLGVLVGQPVAAGPLVTFTATSRSRPVCPAHRDGRLHAGIDHLLRGGALWGAGDLTASLTIAPSQTITASYPGSTSFLRRAAPTPVGLHGYWTVARDGASHLATRSSTARWATNTSTSGRWER